MSNQAGGPPPWVPFGQKIISSVVEVTKEKEAEPEREVNEEFENQRQEAIAAAAHTGQKKDFKGSGKQVGHN